MKAVEIPSEIRQNNAIPDNDLPEGWAWCGLDMLTSALESGGRPKGGVKNIQSGVPSIGGEHLNDEGGFRFDKTRYVPEAYFTQMKKGLIKRNDILIVKDGATTGKTSFVDDNFPFEKAAVNEHVFILRGFCKAVEQRYLFRFLFSQEGQRQIQEKFQGSAQGGINARFIINFPIPLPPLPEQRLIVARVEALLEQVRKAKEALEKVPQIMKRFRQAVLKKAFSGELTAEWRAQQEDIKQFETRSTGLANDAGIPDNWTMVTLGDVVDLISGVGFPMKYQSRSGLPYPFFKVADLGKVDSGQPLIYSEHTVNDTIVRELRATVLPVNAVVFAKIGMAIRLNRRRLLGVPGCIDNNMMAAIPSAKVMPRYLLRFLETVDLMPLTQETTVPSLRKADLARLNFPLPPISEQQEIVRRVEALFKFADEVEKRAGEARKQVEKLTQSILARAFRGELTADFREAVKNWKSLSLEERKKYIFTLPEAEQEKALYADEFPLEPAEQLLQRIREERAKREQEKKTARARKSRKQSQQLKLMEC